MSLNASSNLDIANMNFDEFADVDEEADEDGCFPCALGDSPSLSDAHRRQRDDTLERFEREGKI
jgi:hypothetical protein